MIIVRHHNKSKQDKEVKTERLIKETKCINYVAKEIAMFITSIKLFLLSFVISNNKTSYLDYYKESY